MPPLPRLLQSSFYALIGFIILFSPLLLGSNRLLPWIIYAGLIALAFALWLAAAMITRQARPLSLKRVLWPILAIAVTIIWSAIQWLPLDYDPLAHPIWAYAEKLKNIDLTSRITANYALTAESLLRLVSYALFSWLILQIATNPAKAKELLTIFVVSAALYAIYGLWAFTQGSETILWMGKRQMLSGLSSTFVNRNNAATYFGLACLVSMSLMIQAYREMFLHQKQSRSMTDWLIDVLASRIGLLFLAFIMFLGCVLLTQSRAGILSTFIALAFALVLQTLLASRSKKGSLTRSSKMRRIFLPLFTCLAIGGYLVLEISGDAFLSRLEETSDFDVKRLNVYRLSLEIIQDFPLIGTGLGTFQTAFLFYQDETLSTNFYWDKAHNSYLEILIGLGIPIGLIFLSIFVWAIKRCTHAFLHRQKYRYFSILGLSSTLLVGLHSLVDFSLQIQAITLAYLLIIASAIAQSWSSRSR